MRIAVGQSRGRGLRNDQLIAEAQNLASFDRGHARIRSQAVVVIEAFGGRPCGKFGFAQFGEALLEAGGVCASVRVTGRNWTTFAGIAAFKTYGTDTETPHAPGAVRDELVLPEGRDACNFETGAKTQANFVVRQVEPFRYRLQAGG